MLVQNVIPTLTCLAVWQVACNALMFHRRSYYIRRWGIEKNAVLEAIHRWIKRKIASSHKEVPYLHGSKLATEGALHKDTLLIAFYRQLNTIKQEYSLTGKRLIYWARTLTVRLLGFFILDHIYKHYFENKMAWVILRIFCNTKCGIQSGHYHIQHTLQLPQFQIVVFCLLLEING